MVSLYVNIQHHKAGDRGLGPGGGRGEGQRDGGVYGRELQQNSNSSNTGMEVTTGLEMNKVGKGKRGSRKGSGNTDRRRESSNGGGGRYARVGNGDAELDGARGEGGAYGVDSEEEEEVDLSLVSFFFFFLSLAVRGGVLCVAGCRNFASYIYIFLSTSLCFLSAVYPPPLTRHCFHAPCYPVTKPPSKLHLIAYLASSDHFQPA